MRGPHRTVALAAVLVATILAGAFPADAEPVVTQYGYDSVGRLVSGR